MLKVEIKKEDKFKQFLENYKLAIIGGLLCLLIYVSFVIGGFYACSGGQMYKGICVNPQPMGTLEICETDPFSCNRNCDTAIVNDFRQFCAEWNIP